MKSKTVDAIRDLALTFELSDLQVAYELMEIAYNERPEGPFIKKKFFEYKQKLESPVENLKLLSLLKSGEIAIIPIGFRCHTKMMIKDKLGFSQASLPFDSGFFSPYSVASIFSSPSIDLDYYDESTHTVCKKYENYNEKSKGKGIKFELSSYDEINEIVTARDVANINKYLDATFGYYTLDKRHKFILAHYNWHALASESKSKGIKDPRCNIPLINKIINSRIERMLDLCLKAKHVFFIYLNQNGNYIKIGDEYYDLSDYSVLENCLNSKYDFNYSILNAKEISPSIILNEFEFGGKNKK